MDRRLHASQTDLQCQSNPRTSAPDFLLNGSHGGPTDRHSAPPSPVVNEKMAKQHPVTFGSWPAPPSWS